MDARHFRQKAADARAMSQTGDDVRLTRMLLEVAREFEAEAEAIEAESAAETHLRRIGVGEAILQVRGARASATPVQLLALSIDGAKFRSDQPLAAGSPITLTIPAVGLALNGSIRKVRGTQGLIAFEPAASSDAGLIRLLQQQPAAV